VEFERVVDVWLSFLLKITVPRLLQLTSYRFYLHLSTPQLPPRSPYPGSHESALPTTVLPTSLLLLPSSHTLA